MLTTLEAAHALRKTAAWLRDTEKHHERCAGAFYRTYRPTGVCYTPFEADQWCAVGRFQFECGRGAFSTTDHDELLGGTYAAIQLEQAFDRGEYVTAAEWLEGRAATLEALIAETVEVEHARA